MLFEENIYRGFCNQTDLDPLKEKRYSLLATLFWNTEGGVIRTIMNNHIEM